MAPENRSSAMSCKLNTKIAQSLASENSAPRDRFRASSRGSRCSAPSVQPPKTTEKSCRSRIGRTLSRGQVAERVGFEPTVGVNRQRFSRPPHSTTLPPLRVRVVGRGIIGLGGQVQDKKCMARAVGQAPDIPLDSTPRSGPYAPSRQAIGPSGLYIHAARKGALSEGGPVLSQERPNNTARGQRTRRERRKDHVRGPQDRWQAVQGAGG